MSLWKDDDLSIFLNEERKPALLPQIVLLCIIGTYLVLYVHKLIVLGRITYQISCENFFVRLNFTKQT